MNKKEKICFIILFILLIMSILLSICIGSVHISLNDLLKVIFNQSNNSVNYNIIVYVRFPRTIACILSGAALAVSGVVIQNVLSNKLASPGIIGINSGAGLAVTLCCACGIFSSWMITGAAFLGALVAVFFVVFLAQKIGASKTTLILSGVAVNGCLNAVSEAISVLMPTVGMMAADFRVGGFSNVTLMKMIPAGIVITICIILLMSLTSELDILSLGEESAHGLGLSVKKIRIIFLAIAALLAGAAVSFSGLLGFIGLVIPHMARKFVSNESYKLIPFSILFGASFVTICDLLSRVLFNPYEIPVGILLSFIGGPFFLYLLTLRKGERL